MNFTKELKDLFPVKKVLLYGSYAKGTFSDDSDIDIAVVIDENDYSKKIEITSKLFKIASDIDVFIEPKCVFWKDYLNFEPASILGEIIRTSKTIA